MKKLKIEFTEEEKQELLTITNYLASTNADVFYLGLTLWDKYADRFKLFISPIGFDRNEEPFCMFKYITGSRHCKSRLHLSVIIHYLLGGGEVWEN